MPIEQFLVAIELHKEISMSEIILKVAIIISALAAAFGAKYLLHWKDDNPVEQVAEEIIKEEIGADIDLSPPSK